MAHLLVVFCLCWSISITLPTHTLSCSPSCLLWPPLPSNPLSLLTSPSTHLREFPTLPALAHQRLHIASHQEGGEDEEDEGPSEEEAEAHAPEEGRGECVRGETLCPTHIPGQHGHQVGHGVEPSGDKAQRAPPLGSGVRTADYSHHVHPILTLLLVPWLALAA